VSVPNSFEKTISINSDAPTIWAALTDLKTMKQWMGEPGMEIEIYTDWEINGPVVIRGFHHTEFENRGVVLCFEPNKLLKYTHLSSLSGFEDIPENYSIIEFRLTPLQDRTELSVVVSNFPTETIFRHLEFYWNATTTVIKDLIEKR